MTIIRKDNRRFGRRGFGSPGGVYACKSCGKKTRETGQEESSIGLCAACQQDAYWTNHHSDCCDGSVPKESCPNCKEAGYHNNPTETGVAGKVGDQ
jgi:hypothetical protein